MLRKEIADGRGVPPFVVFGNVSLQQMAYYFPQSRQSFSRISGVGSRKLEEFGDAFLRVIRDYAHKNGLAEREAPTSRRERSRRSPTAGTTYSETKRLIEHGEILDISHVLPPPDRVSAIEAAFKSTGSYQLSPARKLLGDGYPYEEIRLVRMHLRQSDSERLSATPRS